MMRCFLARDGAPHRAALPFVAAAVLALPPLRAADAQAVPVGRASQAEAFATLLAPSFPYVERVQPKLLIEAPALGDPNESPQRPPAPMRPVLPNPDVEPALLVNPEPSTFVLLGGAGAVLGLVARRRARGRAV